MSHTSSQQTTIPNESTIIPYPAPNRHNHLNPSFPHPNLTFSYRLLSQVTIVTNKHFTSPSQLFLIITFHNRHNRLNHSNSILHNNDNISHLSCQHLSQPSESTFSHLTLTLPYHLLLHISRVTTATTISIHHLASNSNFFISPLVTSHNVTISTAQYYYTILLITCQHHFSILHLSHHNRHNHHKLLLIITYQQYLSVTCHSCHNRILLHLFIHYHPSILFFTLSHVTTVTNILSQKFTQNAALQKYLSSPALLKTLSLLNICMSV